MSARSQALLAWLEITSRSVDETTTAFHNAVDATQGHITDELAAWHSMTRALVQAETHAAALVAEVARAVHHTV